MTVPTTPHLAWGGTDCPGARWREWVPQLRTQALATEEGEMTDEQYAGILAAIASADAKAQGRRDQIIKAIASADAKAQGRRDQILKAIAAIGTGGGGPTAAEIVDEIAERLKD